MLTEDRNTSAKDGDLISLPVAASATIHAGSIVMLNSTGFAVKGQTATGLTYAGRAEQALSNLGADGAGDIMVRRNKAFLFKNDGSITQAHVLKPCYVIDDETVAATDGTGTRSQGGTIIGLEGNQVWIE